MSLLEPPGMGGGYRCPQCGTVGLRLTGLGTIWQVQCLNGHDLQPIPGLELTINGPGA